MKPLIKTRQKVIKARKTCVPLVMLLGGLSLSMLTPQAVQAQNRNYFDKNITCNSSWGGGTKTVDLGTIADPSAINSSITDVPVDAGCKSTQFWKTPGKNEWRSHGAYCLTIVTAGSAAQRELKLVGGDPSAPSLKFNFAYAGNTSPQNAIGNAIDKGIGVSYYGSSMGANTTLNGPALPISQNNDDFGVYLHPSSGQPSNLQSGVYEGIFTWQLYAGTTTADPKQSAPSYPYECASKTGFNKAQTGQIKITVKVEKSCSLTVPAINFGRATNAEMAAGIGSTFHNLEVKCNNKNDMFITIGAGLHSGGDINNRSMKHDSGSELIKYNLIKPGGGEWGDAANSNSGYLVPQTGAVGSTQIVPIEARIPPQTKGFPNGIYKDTVQVQLWN